MATTFGRLFANGTIIVPQLDEVSFPSDTKLTANTTAFYYPEFDEVTATTVQMRQQSTRLIANGVFDEVSILGALPLDVTFLVIAGGGGGGIDGNDSGGGGAGGYRSSVAGESSGGGASAESPLSLLTGTTYSVTIGVGGVAGNNGADSIFHTITSLGGGRGGGGTTSQVPNSGGSGGGSGDAPSTTAGAGTTGQGYAGGAYVGDAGGGGGAGGVGKSGSDATGYSAGGIGVQSNITGTPTYRAGGGGGGTDTVGRGLGGLGGGGNANAGSGTGGAGTNNTGGGGGGVGSTGAGGTGGSGVVILRYPNTYTITLSGGITGSTSTVGSDYVTQITAGTGTVSWA